MAGMEKKQIADLVRKAQAGDGGAMNELLKAAYKNVLFQCQRIMKHPEDAEDMAQEVLIKIYETLDTLREPEHFISWANTIATRRCLNERRRSPKDLQFLEDEDGNSVLDDLEELDQQSMPEAALDNEETRRMVRELIDKLPESQRVAVMSHYNAEMSVKEIAELLGVSENTVKSRLNYGRKAIEKGVKEYEKQGIKLYGLSPLPFLLYFLRSAAEMGSDAAASAAASAVLSTGAAAAGTAAAEAAGSAGAAGSAASASASGTAAGTAVSSAGTSAAGSAAGTGAAVGGTTAGGGLLSGVGVKAAAILLAGAVAVGGGAVLLGGQQSETPDVASSQSGQLSEPPQEENTAGIYLETPRFEEVNEGYRQINAFFDELHQTYFSDNWLMTAYYESYQNDSLYRDGVVTGRVVYQDRAYLTVALSTEPTEYALYDLEYYTFDVRTGQRLTLADLCSGTQEEALQWVTDAILASPYGGLLNESNAPSADHGFRLAACDLDVDGLTYQCGQPLYLWWPSRTSPLTVPIPLPVEPMRGGDLAETTPPYVTHRTDLPADLPEVMENSVSTPLFESDQPGYQALNQYLEAEHQAMVQEPVTFQPVDLTSPYRICYYWVVGQGDRYVSVVLIRDQVLDNASYLSIRHSFLTFDLETCRPVTLEEVTGLTGDEVMAQVRRQITSPPYSDVPHRWEDLSYDNTTFYCKDGGVYYVHRESDGFALLDYPFPLTLPEGVDLS